jgi:hypothetical protein
MQTQLSVRRFASGTIAGGVHVRAANYYHLVTIVPFCLLAGCGNTERANVSGEVKLGNNPLVSGLVTFRPTPETPGPEFSAPITDGQYQVEASVLPGQYHVDVRSWQKTGNLVPTPYGEKTEEIVNVVPRRYWDDGTVLKATLKAGDNAVDFNLEQK